MKFWISKLIFESFYRDIKSECRRIKISFLDLTVGDNIFFMRSPMPQSMSSSRTRVRKWPLRPQGTRNFLQFDIEWGMGDEDLCETSWIF